MDVSWEARQLIAQVQNLENFPEDILKILCSRPNEEYLHAVAGLALDSRFTSAVFATHSTIFVEICSRWLDRTGEDHLFALSALSRVVSLRPCLRFFAAPLLNESRSTVLKALASRTANALLDVPQAILTDLLLTINRLLVFDNAGFAEYVAPAQMQSLLAHGCPHIRFMAVRILALYLHASDGALGDMIKRYVGEKAVYGQWEGKEIDYTFLTLWEKRRLEELARKVEETETARNNAPVQIENAEIRRIIKQQEFSGTTAFLGGVLVPRFSSSTSNYSSFVMTESSRKDLSKFVEGLNSGKPLIVTGLEGSGKTAIIRHAARVLGADSNMVTLHLNEQTDAKLLVGMYTNDNDTDHFSWKPGVLTKAVVDGRWLVIEDLDRAPTEILSLLLPLLERRELFVPSWGENVIANSGFQLIATVRTSEKFGGEELDPSLHLLGRSHWSRVAVSPRKISDLATIIKQRNPVLNFHLPQILAVYSALRNKFADPSFDLKTIKPPGSRELLRWSARLEGLLLDVGVNTGGEPISDATKDCIFLEAIDCFAAAIPGSFRKPIIDLIAAELQIPPERVRYCLETRVPRVHQSETVFSVGRVKLTKSKDVVRGGASSVSSEKHPFAISEYVSRILESVSVTVKQAEPCLLVGETGTGKTTVLQNLAHLLDKRLIVINLSQQSESGDLLGSLKPINIRSLAMPMRDEFNELLLLTFASKTNQQVVTSLNENIAKARWSRVLHIWQKTVESVQRHVEAVLADTEKTEEPQSKRRKVRKQSYQQLQPRWKKFAIDLERFSMHLSGGSKGFAFHFVEGSVVRAARNGDWVLLDEINLATPDTLESLSDLLYCEYDGRPSLLLSETGSTERIQAHPDFRIFGAMNPATDTGKRDLPPSIRSRFSEFYIDGLDFDLKNLVPLVNAYLGSSTHSDVHLATDIAELYLKIKDLERANILADGSDRKAHFSLRNLSRALNYAVDLAPTYGLRRALYEGFCMTFTTSLNKESEIILRPLIQDLVFGSAANHDSILHQTPRLPQDGKRYVQFRHYWVAQGKLPVEKNPQYIRTPFIERNLLNLVRATSTRKYPVLLQGPTSSGKTSMVEYLAKISGNKFVRINNHEHTDLQEYLGSYVSGNDGEINYQEGLLVQALKEGSWIVLDELNLAPTDVLEALNRLLDDNRELYLPDTQQVIRPHENFMLFATQNPPGLYGGRKALSRAFQNRFLELHFDDIPEDELETILRERSQIAPSFCKKIVAVYQKLSILRQTTRLFEQRNSFATLRDLFRWALRDADDREQLAINGFLLLAERVRDAKERLSVKRVIEEVMKVEIDEDQVYSRRYLEQSLGSPLPNPQGITWTKSMRRLYVLVTEALKNHEPVLLVGHTGLGKTTICQAIAETVDTQIHIVNAHQNMETGDLIGAQRPVRHKITLQEELSRDYLSALKRSDLQLVATHDDMGELAKQYDNLIREAPEHVPNELRMKIQQNRSKANTLFEWSDGSLVQAMRAGHYYLLDEISLADDSVLERLNSVLEPRRSLLLAEKGTYDVQVRAADGFQFLATMNPGGDYGKRELSPALRNRFTEIWVPAVSEEAELIEIILAKLPSSKTELAKPMVDFAEWHSSRSDVNITSLSIRDLLSWAKFVFKFQEAETAFLAFHGAAMVYLDGTQVNSNIQTSLVSPESSQGVHASLQKLSELFCCDIMSQIHAYPSFFWDTHHIQFGDFALTRLSEEASNSQYSLLAPTTRLNAMKIVRAMQLQKPILLEGSPGVGKTTLISTLAHAVGVPLTRINLSDQTDLMDLFGSDVPLEGKSIGHFGWRDAPFLRAMQRGEWVLLDEMNLASQSVLEGLNACLDHRGQVYISELNRTFQRHPNFVVFAAQNPQSQGGGRKGLPASFVNRFTTVFAAPFSTKDLQLICSDLFTEVSPDIIKRLINCLLALNIHFDKTPRIGTSGGPWSMNLRDILRWLQLLTYRKGLTPFASPLEFADLLILQRFRSFDDRASIATVVQNSLNHVYEPRGYYHVLSPQALQVGSVILPRDSSYRPLLTSDRVTCPTNLQTIESIMICIQMNWPCLLVGPTGSGKTTVIRQIASSVGAELVTIALNPDIDTSDLVGGLEQSNPDREITSFIKRAQACTEKAIITSIINGSEAEISGLLEVRKRLVDMSTDMMQPLKAAAQRYPSSIFSELLQEYQVLMKRIAANNRARFEWVDGVLVQAVKHGKWLIMNNANLCEASVLDRINSLLEPDGRLSINEHRDTDGSAQIVKPHPAFRLFITMDPRHGELSRAMRNRSVEIFFPTEIPCPTTNVFGLDIEAAVARFQNFQVFDWANYDDTQFVSMMNICLQHLSVPDFELCGRWETQMLQGLTNIPPTRYQTFRSLVSIYRDMMTSRHAIVENIQTCYLSISKSLDCGEDLPGFQSIHPFNNDIMLSAASRVAKVLQNLGHCFDLVVEISVFKQKLANAKHGISLKRLEVVRSAWDDTTQNITAFLEELSTCLNNAIASFEPADATDNEFPPFAKEVMAYLVDLFDSTMSGSFDESVLLTYQSIGWSLVAHGNSSEQTHNVLRTLAKQLASNLSIFSTKTDAWSGLAMEQLWAFFKPPTAATKPQFVMCIEIEALADRFDALKWSSGASIKDLVMLRDTLVALNTSINNRDSWTLPELEKAKALLTEVERHARPFSSNTAPYFQAQFETLTQFQFIENRSGIGKCSILELLADRPTKASMALEKTGPGWQILSKVFLLSAGSQQRDETAILRQAFPISAIQKLGKFGEVPLSGLRLLTDEIKVLSTHTAQMCCTVGDDVLVQMNQNLTRLRSIVIRAFQPQTQFGKAQNLAGISALRERLKKISISKEGANNIALSALFKCSSQILNFDPSIPENSLSKTVLQLAKDWIQFFAGLSLLYIPNGPLDPALRPSVELSRYRKHVNEIQTKLDAMKTFQISFTGQKSSYRIRRLEDELKSLGTEPSVSKVHRPVDSKLPLLQNELNIIMKSIILRVPGSLLSDITFRGDEIIGEELEGLRLNIVSAVSRLSGDFREYDDITKPVLAMLHGLDIGLSLAMLAGTETSKIEESVTYLSRMTPFMGASPLSVLTQSFRDLENMSLPGVDLRLFFLEAVALVQSVELEFARRAKYTMLESFHSLYREWKVKLNEDQREKAAESSLYRYRSVDDGNEGLDAEDLLQIFQTHDAHQDKSTLHADLFHNPKAIALRVSNLHRDIFQPSGNAADKILHTMDNVSIRVARLWSKDGKFTSLPVTAENLLPALIQNLSKVRNSLEHPPDPGKLYNFYMDANIVEAEKIVILVQDIQARFDELQKVWPEHATLDDVLRTSKELLSFGNSVPVAKMLTKAEQLHSFLHEWQVVASREFTAVGLFDQLTNLLINWRRLELMTWGQLLEMEDKSCKEDADSWWFIAYEVIIAAPMSLIHEQEDVSVYAQQLYTILEKFLLTTSKGQYIHRLKLIKCFEDHLALLAEEHKPLHVIRSSLNNFLRFHHHFDEPIQQIVKEGRKSLENELKEVLLIASWKDTNIVALRDSAKRSHRKLFKLVRRYRSLLAQPADESIRSEISDPVGDSHGVLSSDSPDRVTTASRQALEFCQKNWREWNGTAARLTNSTDTAQTMLQLTGNPKGVIDAAFQLKTLVSNLRDSMALLQQETPNKITPHNKVAIKHLKTRKRKLFSDTLKAVRQMGFSSNINSAIIKKQESTAAVLSSSLSFGAAVPGELAQAEHYIDRILTIMTRIREEALHHSEDLTHGEIFKGIGYLESMLSTILKQKTLLVRSTEDLATLNNTLVEMNNMWAPERYIIKHKNAAAENSERNMRKHLRWILRIVEVGIIILGTHQKLSESNSEEALAFLMTWKTKIQELNDEIDDLPNLPTGISSTVHMEVFARSQAMVQALQDQLKHKKAEYPNLAFIFKQVEIWNMTCEVDSDYEMDEPQNLLFSAFAESISNAVNSILVAVQHMREASESRTITSEDARWLLEVDSVIAKGLEKLHGRGVDHLLRSAISQIPCLDVSERQGIELASALCAISLPIVQQYNNTFQKAFLRYSALHLSLCRLTSVLAKTFLQLIGEGFCSPNEEIKSAQDQDEKLEGGTGLGDGEGAEDISKDIGDDEDLTDIAQNGEKDDVEPRKDEIQDEKDALDMNRDEISGENGDDAEDSDESNGSHEDDDNEIDDEIGSVDDLDPGAVDEKFWDSKGRDAEKDKANEKARGQADDTENGAAEKEHMEGDDRQTENGKVKDVDTPQDPADESDEVAREEMEKLYPYTQEEQNLDLPEEMDLDMERGFDGLESEDNESTKLSDVDDENELVEDANNMEVDKDADLINEPDADGSASERSENPEDNNDIRQDYSSAASPVDTEPEDEGDENHQNQEMLSHDNFNGTALEVDDVAVPSEAEGLGQDTDQTQANDDVKNGRAQTQNDVKNAFDEPNNVQVGAGDDKISEGLAKNQQGPPQNEEPQQEPASQAFKKLGDALEDFHRQLKHIQEASDATKENPVSSETQIEEFEHLGNDQQDDSTQALGPTSVDLARPLHDEDDSSEVEKPHAFPLDLEDEKVATNEDEESDYDKNLEANAQNHEQRTRAGAFVGEHSRPEHEAHQPSKDNLPDLAERMDELENDTSSDLLPPPIQDASKMSVEEALKLWSYYEAITRDLTLFLTEQLRLILTPTQATKMRGDFRTGKRLNIKRIIPYIASNFKQDKIWMRRSIPSKRNYQILLALDDSKSMSENGSGRLAFQTLAVVTKSLSTLEVGEICIVGFGNNVFVAHEFNIPFTSEAGANVLQQFNFHQAGTNVANLVERSIKLLREARLKQTRSSQDLLQLELIISDGLCEDHEKIRRLVRQATEERIMIVFIIVDALLQKNSILDLTQAVFEDDPGQGKAGVRIKRYLDDFPFTYYLVVGDVRDLPSVLAQALRQWFAEVVGI